MCIGVTELKWRSWVSKGWDIRQEKREEKQKIAAGGRCAGSKRVQGGMGKLRLGEGLGLRLGVRTEVGDGVREGGVR